MDEFWQAVITSIRSQTGHFPEDAQVRPVGGGCINRAFLLESSEGMTVFVKTNSAARLPMFEAESEGLRTIARSKTIRVPEPIDAGAFRDRAFLALEHIPMSSRNDVVSQGKMGAQLAALHRVTSDSGAFGWHRGNTIGELPQENPWTDSWAGFFRNHRLGFQFDLAAKNGREFRRANELLDRLPDLLDGREPEPSLLHGDLWGGNAAFDPEGNPVIYDPATYFGDRETDLAFTEMFGGFGPTFYEAYRTAWPLSSGYEKRRTLYNLYHVLNHHNHFGGGYDARADSMIDRLLAD